MVVKIRPPWQPEGRLAVAVIACRIGCRLRAGRSGDDAL